MASIVIIGAGQMGSALTVPLADNGHQVHLVGSFLEMALIEELRTTRHHPELGLDLPDAVQFYSDDQLEEALQGAAMVLVAVHSLGIDWVGMMLGFALPPGVPVVLASRGIMADGEQLQPAAEALGAHLPADSPVFTLAGPLLASELAQRRPSVGVIAGDGASDRANGSSDLATVAGWMQGDALHIALSNDGRGVSVCSALVNLYGIAVGMGETLGAASALFAQSQLEMAYLVDTLGGDPKTAAGLAGAGDLFATAQLAGPSGRHRALGELLGRGLRYADAVRQMDGATIEGAELALSIGATVERQVRAGALDAERIPLLRTMVDIVCNDGVAPDGLELFGR